MRSALLGGSSILPGVRSPIPTPLRCSGTLVVMANPTIRRLLLPTRSWPIPRLSSSWLTWSAAAFRLLRWFSSVQPGCHFCHRQRSCLSLSRWFNNTQPACLCHCPRSWYNSSFGCIQCSLLSFCFLALVVVVLPFASSMAPFRLSACLRVPSPLFSLLSRLASAAFLLLCALALCHGLRVPASPIRLLVSCLLFSAAFLPIVLVLHLLSLQIAVCH